MTQLLPLKVYPFILKDKGQNQQLMLVYEHTYNKTLYSGTAT